MKKLFILSIKLIPIIQMVGMLVGNTLVYFGVVTYFSFIMNLLIGNSVITTILLLFASYSLKFCNWHRLIIISNFITILMVQYDAIFHIPLSNRQLLLSYYIVYTIFIIISIYSKFNCHVNKTINQTAERNSE